MYFRGIFKKYIICLVYYAFFAGTFLWKIPTPYTPRSFTARRKCKTGRAAASEKPAVPACWKSYIARCACIGKKILRKSLSVSIRFFCLHQLVQPITAPEQFYVEQKFLPRTHSQLLVDVCVMPAVW